MALAVDSALGHYHVTALIGSGGMGQVWQATDTQLNRQVNPPFWKGAPYPATLGRSHRFTCKDFDLGWEANGKACSFSRCHYEGP